MTKLFSTNKEVSEYLISENSGIKYHGFHRKLKFSMIFVFVLLMCVGSLNAATITSTATGNWSAGGTWVGGAVPKAGDDVIIEKGHIVTVYTTDATCNTLTLGGAKTGTNRSGTLAFATTGTPKLTVSGLVQIGSTTNNASNGTIALAGGASLDAGSVAMGNNTSSSSSTLTMTDNSTLITGSFSVGTAGGTTSWAPGTGTVILDATNTLPSLFNLFNNLEIRGVTTLSTATTVTGNLTLTNGNLTTTSTNLLSITNTASSAISGGSTASYINGPVRWSLPTIASGTVVTYNFPVGNSTYLPFSLVNPITSGATTAQVQAYNAASGGTANVNTTDLSSKSNSEYWLLTPGDNKFTKSSITLGKGSDLIFPYDVIANSTTLSGTYNTLNGSSNTYNITGSDAVAYASNLYFVLAANAHVITTSTPSLNGFTYVYDKGPSPEQSFVVSGTKLMSDITINAGTDYEISTTSGTGFQSSITLLKNGTSVGNTTIYVRLKAGLSDATTVLKSFNENISISSTGATTKTISCTGTVTKTAPTIKASGAYCSGLIFLNSSSSSNISNLYWMGPSSFYSTQANPTISTSSSAYSGAYTVYGTVLSGVNLVTNGDFEQGNTGFTSAYTYRDSTYVNPADATGTGTKYYGALYNEANYSIVANPHNVHINFSNCPDHTPSPGKMQMVINGAGVANVVVWSETVPVQNNTYYQFTYWLQSVNSTSPSQLQLFINGVAVGPIYTAQSTTCLNTQYYYNWNSGSATTAVLSLVNQNTATGGNDFALDDIVFQSGSQVNSSVNITVGTTTPSVAISATATSVSSGTSVTYTALPTNGGDSPNYQWYVNNVAVGTNSTTYTYIPQNTDVIKCTMTSTATSCAASQQITSGTITMAVTARSNFWTGATSTAWDVASNWTDHIPLTGEDVYFASTINGYSSNAVVNNLSVAGEKVIGKLISRNAGSYKVIIPAGSRLVVNDTILTNGTTDDIYIQASSAVPNGVLVFHNKAKNSVKATVEMYSKATITTDVNNTKYFNWQFFGIPVTSMTASPWLNGAYVRQWHEEIASTSTHWQSLSNQSVLIPFYAYELCQTANTTYVFQGNLVNSDFYASSTNYTSSASSPQKLPFTANNGWIYAGQTIFANPYTAPIDITQLQFGTGVDNGVYQYNTGSLNDWTSSGSGAATQVDVVSPGQYIYSPKNLAGTSGIPRYVPSMGNMLVWERADDPNATFGFVYNNVVSSVSSGVQRVNALDQIDSSMVTTRVEVAGEKGKDCAWLVTETACTKSYDNGWDGQKIPGSALSPQIYTLGSDGNYQINAVDNINGTDMAFQAGSDINYTLKFSHTNIRNRYTGIYLFDKIENQTIDITESGSEYKFSAESTSSAVNRFKILSINLDKNTQDNSGNVKVFGTNGMIFVQNLSTSKGDATIYDIAGRFVKKVQFNSGGITILSADLKPGAYITKCVTESDEITRKVIVR